MNQLYIRSLEELFKLYNDACEWFSTLGFSWGITRYGTYKKHFDKFQELAASRNDSSFNIEMKNAFDNAYLEANEIIRVYSALKQLVNSEFYKQLKHVLSGQEYRGLVDNDTARDFLFELSTAARFLQAGYKVKLSGLCDVVVENMEGDIFIECKRIKSTSKIAKNIKAASEQINNRLKANPSKKVLGLVAVNVTDLIQNSSMLLPDSPQAAMECQQIIANAFLSKHSENLTPKSRSKRLLGIMIECSSIWHLSERSPIIGIPYTRHTNFITLAKSEILEPLGSRICNQDII